MRPFAIARLLFALLLASLAPAMARAQCTSASECILPPGSCAYVAQSNAVYGISATQHNFFLDNGLFCDPFLGLGGNVVDALDATCTVELSTDGVTYTTYGAPAHLLVHLVTNADNGVTKSLQTEIFSMDITGGTLPAGVKLRESPTLPTLGQAQSQSLGGGLYQIDSFFDVFTELSLDGGQLWSPSTSNFRITMAAGPPLPVEVTTWGSVKAIYR